MNIYTENVMKLLNVDEIVAKEVTENMQISFSNCSKRQFDEEAKITYQVLKMTKGKSAEEIQKMIEHL